MQTRARGARTTAAARPWSSSSWRSGRGTAQQRVDVDEIIGDRQLYVMLWNVALGAEIPARRNRRQELAVAIGEMRDADHRRLRFAYARARMTGQALVGLRADLVAFGRVRDERRLLGVIARFPH